MSNSYAVFCFKNTATTEIYTYLHTLSLHDALPIYALQSHNLMKHFITDKRQHNKRMREDLVTDDRRNCCLSHLGHLTILRKGDTRLHHPLHQTCTSHLGIVRIP